MDFSGWYCQLWRRRSSKNIYIYENKYEIMSNVCVNEVNRLKIRLTQSHWWDQTLLHLPFCHCRRQNSQRFRSWSPCEPCRSCSWPSPASCEGLPAACSRSRWRTGSQSQVIGCCTIWSSKGHSAMAPGRTDVMEKKKKGLWGTDSLCDVVSWWVTFKREVLKVCPCDVRGQFHLLNIIRLNHSWNCR